MARYIDIDKYLKGTFCDKFDDCTLEEECLECWAKRNTEDVAPVVHAEWEWSYHRNESECSNCGHWSVVQSNYCPDCGARMDKE